MAQHSMTLHFNEQPKGRVLIISKISKGSQSLQVLDIDATEHSYKELDVDVYDHREKE